MCFWVNTRNINAMIIMKQDDDDVVACDVTIPQFASSSRTIGYYVQYASVHQQQGMKKNRTASYICVNAAAAKSTWSRKNYDSRLLALNSELGQIVLLFFFYLLCPLTMYGYVFVQCRRAFRNEI